jgi:hypothetical protein
MKEGAWMHGSQQLVVYSWGMRGLSAEQTTVQ